MHIHDEELSDIVRYLEKYRHLRIEDYERQFQNYLRLIRRYLTVSENTRILEIGTGTGWFPILCAMRGIACKGLEISPQLVDHALGWARSLGVETDIEVGNIEEADVGENQYDAVVAFSVFEHVERWRAGLERVYRALQPGGVLVFGSTNKFGPSAEFDFPFYGWLPDRWRYRLRIASQGPDIMKLGIDFNQFTYPQLRRAFREVGFREVYDRVEIGDPDYTKKPLRRQALRICKRFPPAKHLALTFIKGTDFVCVK